MEGEALEAEAEAKQVEQERRLRYWRARATQERGAQVAEAQRAMPEAMAALREVQATDVDPAEGGSGDDSDPALEDDLDVDAELRHRRWYRHQALTLERRRCVSRSTDRHPRCQEQVGRLALVQTVVK